MTEQQNTAPAVYDFTVFIGRFQPFHNGHLAIVEEALNKSQHVIILCGSAHVPRSLRNPWTFSEREEMIRSHFTKDQNERISIAPLMDVTYNDALWVESVQETVSGLVRAHHKIPHRKAKIALIGHQKDNSSYYLSLFPQWDAVGVQNQKNLDATTVREGLLGGGETAASGLAYLNDTGRSVLPVGSLAYLSAFCQSDAYKNLCQEKAFVENYKKAWDAAPYPPTFVTVDGVVIQSGHVLLIERKAFPGKGMLALPGGFLDGNEKLEDACLRELREETKLKVPTPVLKGSIKDHKVFDDPYRSMRGRTITHAFLIELAPDKTLPKVKGGDDAKHAMWVPLADLNPEHMFEDHYFIIQHMVGVL